ncbi:SdpI family protein [Chitinophaga sp. Hz27]|uniref:SdpI family protein n=1 Tax=Chitinophaga sp. Hz27 TaxID=3347169 RepID=UPI0035DBC668
MKANNWRKEWLSVLIMATPFLVYLLLRAELPAKIPSHYSFTSKGMVVDSHMAPLPMLLALLPGMLLIWAAMTFLRGNPSMQLISLPAMPQAKYWIKIALLVLLAAIPVVEMLKATNYIPQSSTESGALWFMLLFLLLANALVFAVFKIAQPTISTKAIHHKYYNILWVATHAVTTIGPLCAIIAPNFFNVEKLIPQFVLVFLTVLGNLLYNVKPNSMMGIRTPWTFSSELIWRKTHHLGGTLLFIGGLTGFIISIFMQAAATKYIMITVILVTALIPIFYSWYLYRQQVNS